MHAAVGNNLQPDLTILLLPPLEAALARARRRNSKSESTDENRFERESDAFYTRIHAAYKKIAAREPHRVHTIAHGKSGDNSIEAIELRIRTLVTERLKQAHSSQLTAHT